MRKPRATMFGHQHVLLTCMGSFRLRGVGGAYDELVTLTRQIARDGDAIAAAGIQLHRWGPDWEGNAVQMLVRSAAAPAQKYMDAAYGQGRVAVRHTDDPPGVRCWGPLAAVPAASDHRRERGQSARKCQLPRTADTMFP